MKKTSQLPNAPLVEVVFEMRWALDGDNIPPPFQNDPGYSVLADAFVEKASKHGFSRVEKMGQGDVLAAHSIWLRLFKSDSQRFPIWQIGPGIFAANESVTYEWNAFKKLSIDGIKVLLNSYPKMKSFGLKPVSLELRYIDSFDSSIATHQNAVKFINERTSLNVETPTCLTKKPFNDSPTVNLLFDFPVEDMKDTHFNMLIANGRAGDKETIVLESKVSTISDTLDIGKTPATRIKRIEKWLDRAHNITSSFFKGFVNDDLMEQFREEPNASK